MVQIFYAALQLELKLITPSCFGKLTAGSRLLRAVFHTGVDRTNEKQQGFLLWMS